MLKIHILVDDRVKKRGLIAEHGLSMWIEKDDTTILFDTGQSPVYCHNAKEMGLELEMVDHIVISHGHYDHCGGLQHFPFKERGPKIYVHQDAFLKKVVSENENGPFYDVGIPFEIDKQNWPDQRIIYTKQPLKIGKGIWVSGEIPCTNTFEGVPKNFYIEKSGKILRDMMLDEQMLIIEEADGIAVFLGCSHPGVINSLRYAQKLVPNKEIKLLIAGMHLEDVSSIRLQMTIQHILDMGVQMVIPLHCTGLEAMCEIKRFLGKQCLLLTTGDTIEV